MLRPMNQDYRMTYNLCNKNKLPKAQKLREVDESRIQNANEGYSEKKVLHR